MDYRSFRKQDFKFWTNLNTRWVDMDSLGHINNAVYLNYIETARVDFFSKIKMPDINKNLEESVILASIEIQYFSQLSHPCSLIIGHRISRIGVKSFDLLAGVFEKKGLGLKAIAIAKMVSFNYIENVSIKIPSPIIKNNDPISK